MVKNKLASTNLYGLVLVGGKSTRMKKDKATLEYHGKPQAIVCYELLTSWCDKVYLSNRSDQSDDAAHKNFPQIHDLDSFSNMGPMGGILSAMKAYPKVSWLVLACDLPHVNHATISHLIQHRNLKKIATAFISTHDSLPEPLCAIYESKGQSKMVSFLKTGKNCPRKFLINSHVELLKQIDPKSLDNVNDQKEYRGAIKNLKFPARTAGLIPSSLMKKIVHVYYYALLREQRGVSEETLETSALTAQELYEELRARYSFKLILDLVKVAINDEFCDWSTKLNSEDTIVLIPPVAGG